MFVQIYGQANDQIYGQANDQIYDQIYGQANDQIYDQSNDQIYGQANDQIYDQVQFFLEKMQKLVESLCLFTQESLELWRACICLCLSYWA